MSDPLTRQTIEGMGKDHLILDANWPDTIRMTDLSTRRSSSPPLARAAVGDPDRKVTEDNVRRKEDQVVPPCRGAADRPHLHHGCARGPPPQAVVARVSQETHWAFGHRARQPAFALVLPNAFFQNGTVYLVGASPSGLSHGSTWRESAHSPLHYGVFACEGVHAQPYKFWESCFLLGQLNTQGRDCAARTSERIIRAE